MASNDELADTALELLDDAGIGYFITTDDEHFLEVSDAFCEMVLRDRDQLLEMHPVELIDPLERAYAAERSYKHAPDGERRRFRTRLLDANGKSIPVQITQTIRRRGEGAISVGLVTNLSAAATIEERSNRQARLIDEMPAGIIVWDAGDVTQPDDFRLETINEAAVRMLGWDRNEVVGARLSKLFPNVDRDFVVRMLALVDTERVEPFGEILFGTRSLQRLYRWMGVALSGRRVAVRFEDITRERAEHLRIRDLSQKLIERSDVDRLALAQTVHDDIIQHVAAATFLFEGYRKTGDRLDHARASDIVEALRTTSQKLRTLLEDLVPPELTDGSLAAALRHTISRQFAGGDTTIDVNVDLDEEPEPAIQIALYRIAVEALTNVRKHAKATSASILIDHRAGRIVLVVDDDGVGPGPPAGPGHIGLRTMAERAAAAGGHFEISQRQTGNGTRVRVELPDRLHTPLPPQVQEDRSLSEPAADASLRRELDSLVASVEYHRTSAERYRTQLDAIGVAWTQLCNPALDQAARWQCAAQMIATTVGDACVILGRIGDGSPRRLALWHADPAQRDYYDSAFPDDHDGLVLQVETISHTRSSAVYDIDSTGWLPSYGAKPPDGPHRMHSALIAPIADPDRHVVGHILVLRDQSPGPYTNHDVEILENIADQLGLVIESASPPAE